MAVSHIQTSGLHWSRAQPKNFSLTYIGNTTQSKKLYRRGQTGLHNSMIISFSTTLAILSIANVWPVNHSRIWKCQDTYSPADWMPTHNRLSYRVSSKILELNSPPLWWVNIQPIWLHCRLAFGNDVLKLGQHWFGWWIVAYHQYAIRITLTNADNC